MRAPGQQCGVNDGLSAVSKPQNGAGVGKGQRCRSKALLGESAGRPGVAQAVVVTASVIRLREG